MKLRWIACCLTGALSLIPGCSSGIADGGSGTQTTNGIRIAVYNGSLSGSVFTVDLDDTLQEIPADTIPVSLHLFNSEYQPYDGYGFSAKPVQDGTGAFKCDSLKQGRYNLFAYDTLNSEGVLISGIPIADSAADYTARAFFKPCGTVRGVIHDTSAMEADCRGAYVLGTPFFDVADSSGSFSFICVPVGRYAIKADYFSLCQGNDFRCVKGFLRRDDSLVVYSDSIQVDIDSDSPVHHIDLSL